jgi:hypothetical protein
MKKEDRDYIAGEIEKAIESLKPRGGRKALHSLREWGVLGQ